MKLYDPMNDRHTGPAEVKERLGIEPAQMRDYLSLVGDAIDNVAKVPGIGPKTAADLITQFGSVEAMLEKLDEVKKPKIREAIASHRESLLRAKQLVTFKTDLPLEVKIEELARRPIHEKEARDLFSELEFFKLLQEMPTEAPTPLATSTEAVRERAALEGWVKRIAEAKQVAIIPAYEGLAHSAELAGLGFALPDGATFYLPVGHRGLTAAGTLRPEAIREVLGPVLADPSVKKSGHDLKSLILLLEPLGIALEGGEGDVELLSYLLNPSRREHALMDLSRERLRVELPPRPGLGTTKKNTLPLCETTIEECAVTYGAAADAARRLAAELWGEIEQVGLGTLARTIELPLTPILAKMERRGIKLDVGVLKDIGATVDADCAVQLSEIHRLAGHEFNVGSNAQLAEVLYDELKLPVLKRGKTGPSTDQEVLEKLAEQHPLAKAIIEYRMLSKLKGTYLDTLPELLGKDGRLHTTFHQTGAATGRLSSSDPNLQNIPIRTEIGGKIRRAFVAEPGSRIVSADYSQIELRLLAHIAQDPALIDAFEKDQDVHTRTAAEVFGVPQDQVTREMRSASKMVNFGIAYGLSPHGLSTRLGIPIEEAASIIERYFQRYAGIKRYLDETVEKAKRSGYVETLFGRRRFMADLNSRNRNAAQAAERAAINHPIQGTAADLIKLAMIEVDARLRREGFAGKMLLQVHDELLFEAPDAEVPRLKEVVRECMSGVAQYRVPLKVEVGAGHSWADAH